MKLFAVVALACTLGLALSEEEVQRTKKYTQFVANAVSDESDVLALPQIGKARAARLQDAGFNTVADVLVKLFETGMEEEAFLAWLMETTNNKREETAKETYDALIDWCDEHVDRCFQHEPHPYDCETDPIRNDLAAGREVCVDNSDSSFINNFIFFHKNLHDFQSLCIADLDGFMLIEKSGWFNLNTEYGINWGKIQEVYTELGLQKEFARCVMGDSEAADSGHLLEITTDLLFGEDDFEGLDEEMGRFYTCIEQQIAQVCDADQEVQAAPEN